MTVIYRKDRKVLKRVDYGAAKNSLMGVLAALLVYALVTAWGGVYPVSYTHLTLPTIELV